jgi:hypothetical protein
MTISRNLAAASGSALLILFGFPGSAAEPRAVVGHVADQIGANYFDPEKAEAIARDLKLEAVRGQYDRFQAPLDLARALTERLKPLDNHFMVAWSPPVAAEDPKLAPRGSVVEDSDRERRSNYGFRAIEILPGSIGLIDLRHFAEFATPGDQALEKADAAMALLSGADAIVIDLRNNGGGYPAMVAYLASYFVPRDANIYNTFKGRGPDTFERPALDVRGMRRTDVPLYILISARTGSAAESFAYTLQSAKRAVIVGETSAGAANPGGFEDAGDGFAVFVSAGRPVNPFTKTNWEGVGVVPDVQVPAADALTRAEALALTRALGDARQGPAATESSWALELLKTPALLISPAALSEYVGNYGSRRITREGSRIVFLSGRRPPLALTPISADVFAFDDKDTPSRVKFERDADKRVTGLVLTFSDGEAQRYARTK